MYHIQACRMFLYNRPAQPPSTQCHATSGDVWNESDFNPLPGKTEIYHPSNFENL